MSGLQQKTSCCNRCDLSVTVHNSWPTQQHCEGCLTPGEQGGVQEARMPEQGVQCPLTNDVHVMHVPSRGLVMMH